MIQKVYSRTISNRNTYRRHVTTKLIAILFNITSIWKQSNYSSVKQSIVVFSYIGILYKLIIDELHVSVIVWLDLQNIMLS